MKKHLLLIILVLSLAGAGAAACTALQAPQSGQAGPTEVSSIVQQPAALPAAATATTPLLALTPITAQAPTTEPLPLPHPDDICQNPYYPVVAGATWRYQATVGGKSTHTITGVNGNFFTISIKSSDSTATMDGQCTDEGIILLDVPGVSGTFNSDGSGASLTTVNQEGVTLPNDLAAGDDWSQTIQMAAQSGGSGLSATIETNYRAIGYEVVTVPAGTFEALKIEQTGTMDMGGMTIETHGFLWYALGVGNVLAEQGLASESPYRLELVSYQLP